MYGPIFICCCCHRRLFRTSVVEFSDKIRDEIKGKAPTVLTLCVYEDLPQKNSKNKTRTRTDVDDRLKVDIGKGKQAWICSTCRRYLKDDKMPPMCHKNNLTIKVDPDLTEPLTELEASLIAPTIPFMKIFPLKTSRWSALDGKVVNVPVRPEDTRNVFNALQTLPRTPDQAGFIAVELKRKLEFKNSHIQAQLVNVPNMIRWVKAFKKAGHPYFKNIFTSQEEYEEHCAQVDPRGWRTLYPHIQDDLMEDLEAAPLEEMMEVQDVLLPSEPDQEPSSPHDGDKEAEEERYFLENDVVRKHQFTYNKSLLMNETHPEMDNRAASSVVSLAPGQGKVPQDPLYDPHWDIKAFPHLNNTDGSNGLYEERDVKLTPQQFFSQRILNVDQRFSKHIPYLYSGVTFQEKNQIRKNMNISYTTGHQCIDANGKLSLHNHDAYTVLKNIKNSPSFWKKKKNNLLSMLDSFGPFHWFFTLSSAEKRWENVFSSTVRGLPNVTKVEITVRKHQNGFSKVKVTVHSIDREPLPLKEFVKTLNDSEHKIIQDNVLTATRVFDHRVKTFIKDIMTGKDNPMHILLYTYRVEFQQRGAAHVHGCLWMNMWRMEKIIKGLTRAYDRLRHDKELQDPVIACLKEGLEIPNDMKPLAAMVDMFTTCSLHPETAGGQDVVDIVHQVNTHHHTKSCKKNATFCRYNIPKMPSEETVIARPVREEEKENLKKAEKALERVRDILNDKDVMQLIWDSCPEKGGTRQEYIDNRRTRIQTLCQVAGVDYETYKMYLKMSRSGYSVVLQRDTDETFINAYNSDWIRAWNGNMDIQPVFGFFAVITYVTEYAFKAEPESGVIRDALKECQDKDMKEQMKILANTFLTSRQMGESEAVYKLLSSLTMTNTTVTVQWISLDREEQQMKRMRRATAEDKKSEKTILTLKDMEGEWLEQWDHRDKYVRRPPSLHHLSFSQHGRMCCSSSKKKNDDDEDEPNNQEKPTKNSQVDEDDPFGAFKTIFGCEGLCCMDPPPKRPSRLSRKKAKQFSKIVPLPCEFKLENPHNGEPKAMRVRKIPASLSFHKENKDRNPRRFFFQELLLYVPFGRPENGTFPDIDTHPHMLGTKDLLTLPDTDVEVLYHKHQDHIKKVKSQVMPYLEDVEEERYFVAEARKNEQINTGQIGDELAPGKEQDNMDTLHEDFEESGAFPHLDPSLLELQAEEHHKVTEYGRIIVPDKQELSARTRSLDKDQRRVLDINLTFCRDIVKARKGKRSIPSPPHLMVHGAAGTGKTTVIDLVSQWGQSTLLKAGDSPEQPYILKVAFTGTAAANIGGQTLTSTFSFQFGNRHFALSDKKRDKTKVALKNLMMVIIDEISLVKADMLYQLDIKLQEIKEKKGEPFGGVMIGAYGDIFQLKPVCGRYTFAEPSNVQYHNTFSLASRWEMLQVLNLEINHRQGKDGAFADLLNRLRFVRRGDMLPEDVRTLEGRVRPANHPDLCGASINIVCTRRKSHQMNTQYLRDLPGDETLIQTHHYKSNQKHFKPTINDKDGSVATTQFMDKLRLKIGAKVMLIKNINTSDCLTNGQTGVLQAILRDEPTGDVRYLIVQFDRDIAGQQARAKDPQLRQTHPGGTKIERFLETYSLKKGSAATATLIQFPIRLAHATTAHKTQGMTVHQPKTSNLDLCNAFEPAQSYTMLGRNQALNQAYIMDRLDPDKIYASWEALEEYDKMNKRALNNETEGWYPEQEHTFKIASLNIARLKPHMEDLIADPTLSRADIIHLCETWVLPSEDLARYNKPGYTATFHNVGPGKGIVTYANEMFEHQQSIVHEEYQATRFSSKTIDSIHVYRSAKGSTRALVQDLDTMIQKNKTTVISGDFNICLQKEPNNTVISYLSKQGFTQLNHEPTHIEGGQIDHVYFRDKNKTFEEPQLLRFSPYYSDHDALCITLKTQQVSTSATEEIPA